MLGPSYRELAALAKSSSIVIDSVQMDQLDEEIGILTFVTSGVVLTPSSLAEGISMFEEEPVQVLSSRCVIPSFQGDLVAVSDVELKSFMSKTFKGVPQLKVAPAITAPSTLGSKMTVSEQPGRSMSQKRHTRVAQELKLLLKAIDSKKLKHKVFSCK